MRQPRPILGQQRFHVGPPGSGRLTGQQRGSRGQQRSGKVADKPRTVAGLGRGELARWALELAQDATCVDERSGRVIPNGTEWLPASGRFYKVSPCRDSRAVGSVRVWVLSGAW